MNKKQKQMVGIGAAILVVIIFIIAFSGGDASEFVGNDLPSISSLNEKEKFAMFSAETGCKITKLVGDLDKEADDDLSLSNFIQETMEISEETAKKYGYTLSEVMAKQTEYQDNKEVQELSLGYVMQICPEIASEVKFQR